MTCKSCDAEMMPWGTKSADVPEGMRVRHNTEMCTLCYATQVRRAKGMKPRAYRPDHCEECREPLRSGSEPKKEGVRLYHSRGVCTRCYRRKYARNRKKLTTPEGTYTLLPPGEGENYPFTDETLARMPADVAAYHLWRRPYRDLRKALA